MTHAFFALLLGLSFGALLFYPGSADPDRVMADKTNIRVNGGDIHFNDRFSLNLQRTLRIPDDGRQYPLPPGLGSFPVYRVRDYPDRVPVHWDRQKGYFIPMYQREAMWINFNAAWWKPNAVKVGVGMVNALSGEEWNLTLDDNPQNYLVAPDQPWLDGIKSGEGVIRQFVAVPLGTGYTVEAQVTGKESDGALRIAVFEPRPGRFPDAPPHDGRYALEESAAPSMSSAARSKNMGLGAGGTMRQNVYPDGYGRDTWDENECNEIVIYIVNSEFFAEITGEAPPPSPVDAETYTAYGFPWFDLYDEHLGDIPAGDILGNVKGTGELDAQNGEGTPDESVIVPDSQVVKLPQKKK